MKETIDLTNWREVVGFVIDCQDQEKSKYWTKEKEINSLRETIKEEIEYLWNNDEINTRKWDECVWNDEVNREYKEYFDLKNVFNKGAIVEEEDYSSTDYELIKKYGRDWYDENYEQTTDCLIKNNLSIDQLESLASLMKKGYYDFWSYEINKKGFIFHTFINTILQNILSIWMKEKDLKTLKSKLKNKSPVKHKS